MKSNRGTSPPAGTWRLARYGYSYGPPQAQAQQPPPPPGVGNISDRSAQPVTSAPQFSVEALRLRDLQTDIRQDVVRNHLIATIGKGEADKLERAIDDFKKSAADDPKSLLPKAEIILQYLIMRDELFSHMQNSDLDGLLDICLRLEAEEMRLFKELLTAELMHARKAITVLKRKSMMPNTLTFDDRTMRELRRYNNPPKIMRDVIAATFLLLGECEDYTADWSHAREMLNPFGKSTGYLAGNRRIKDRFDDFDPLAIPPEIGARARELLDAYTLSNVYEVSECCATFYVWCKAALDAAAQHIGNAKPASSVRQRELLGMSSFPTSRGSPRGGTGRIYQRPRGAFSPNQNMEARLPALKTRGSYPSTQFMFTGGLARR